MIQNGKTVQDKVFLRVNRKAVLKIKQMYFGEKVTFFDKKSIGNRVKEKILYLQRKEISYIL